MTLVILWTALGILCGCLIANAANRNLCYQIVKKLLTNNLEHDIIVYMGRAILSYFSFNNPMDGYSELVRYVLYRTF